ncbi:SH3 domain-containing protein [Escherichia coli]|nr:SH3 domain-containing protein [Escherichia coli]MCN2053317.1 SH3 domain-containing protein [Escherichia coli]MCN8269044.1 SH3 domain-containing protein [Escherichia coli]
MKSLNGWYWALRHSGESGWVPEECVNILDV